MEDLNLVVLWRCEKPSIDSSSAFLAPVHPSEGSGYGLEGRSSVLHKYPVAFALNPDNMGEGPCQCSLLWLGVPKALGLEDGRGRVNLRAVAAEYTA